jgi:hypothetical protein
MGGKERPGSSPHRRRQAARWLLVAGGILLLTGVIVFIVGTAFVSRGGGSPQPGNTVTGTSVAGGTESASPGSGSTGTASPSVAAGSSPWNATNVFGGITAITGLIGALTGLASLMASRHQAPATVYLMAGQPPMASPGPAGVRPAEADRAPDKGTGDART